jgi:hypothetical protein
MRQPLGWLAVAMLSWGCSADPVLFSPTARFGASVRPFSNLEVPPDGWLPWYWPEWQPGAGEPLVPGATLNAVVEANDICVANVRRVWDARSSCRRYVVEAPSTGRFDATLVWDQTAPGFDLRLAGEVVLVAPNGRFASSDWQQLDLHVFAVVEPGTYGLVIISYAPVSLPFQLTTAMSAANSP